MMRSELSSMTPQALANLYAYRKVFLSVAMNILNNQAEAEDVIQDAFLTVLANPSGYSGEGTLFCFIYGVVRFKSLNVLRRRGKYAHIHIDDPRCLEGLNLPSPVKTDSGLLKQEKVELAFRYARALSDKVRPVIEGILMGADIEDASEARYRNGRMRGIRIMNDALAADGLARRMA